MWRATEMTAVEERPMIKDRMVRLFESLEVPEGFKVELLRGEIVMMAGPDWVHNDIVEYVADQIPRERWQRKQTQDIALPGESSVPQPDLVVLEREVYQRPGRYVPCEVVTLLVEVVSKTSAHRDYAIKRSLYAAGRVPAYLIIDPLIGRCTFLTEPTGTGDKADYRTQRTSMFGEPVPIDVLNLKLETTEFRTLS
jgi:Uma2 family endonuclease